MKNSYWSGVGKLLYILGAISLLFDLVLFSEFNTYLDSPYWALAASVAWLLFLVTIALFVLGANVVHLPAPKSDKKSL